MSFRIKDVNGKIISIGTLKEGVDVLKSTFTITDFDSLGSELVKKEHLFTDGNFECITPPTSQEEYISGNFGDGKAGYIRFPDNSTTFYFGNVSSHGSSYPPSSDISFKKPVNGLPFMFLAVPHGQRPQGTGSERITRVIMFVASYHIYEGYYYEPYLPTQDKYFEYFRGVSVIEEPTSEPVDDINGTYDNTSDNITIPTIQDINAVSVLTTGLLKAYKMEFSDVTALANFLWSTSYYDTVLKNQNSPIENIQKLYCLPFNVSAEADTDIIVGNVNAGIQAQSIVKQFQEFNCGTVSLQEYYGNALDYMTDVSIYLPFIGECQLDVNDVMQGQISLVYRIDIVTGNCIAIISVERNRNGTALNSVLYQFSGNMGNEFPLTQYTNQTLADRRNTLQNIFSNPLGSLGTLLKGINDEAAALKYGSKWNTQRTGNVTSNNGFMGVLTPYFILKMPINIKPKDYAKYFGLPSYYTRKLSELSGYTEVSEIDLTGMDLTSTEKSRLENILKSGFYI